MQKKCYATTKWYTLSISIRAYSYGNCIISNLSPAQTDFFRSFQNRIFIQKENLVFLTEMSLVIDTAECPVLTCILCCYSQLRLMFDHLTQCNSITTTNVSASKYLLYLTGALKNINSEFYQTPKLRTLNPRNVITSRVS